MNSHVQKKNAPSDFNVFNHDADVGPVHDDGARLFSTVTCFQQSGQDVSVDAGGLRRNGRFANP